MILKNSLALAKALAKDKKYILKPNYPSGVLSYQLVQDTRRALPLISCPNRQNQHTFSIF